MLLFHKESDDRREEKWLRTEQMRLIGKKKESEGMRADMKMTLIEGWNDSI